MSENVNMERFLKVTGFTILPKNAEQYKSFLNDILIKIKENKFSLNQDDLLAIVGIGRLINGGFQVLIGFSNMLLNNSNENLKILGNNLVAILNSNLSDQSKENLLTYSPYLKAGDSGIDGKCGQCPSYFAYSKRRCPFSI
jgi:hypothetical protein